MFTLPRLFLFALLVLNLPVSAQTSVYDIQSSTGKYSFSYQQTPDALQAVNPAGNIAPYFQWQKATTAGSFTNISGATSAGYTPPANTTNSTLAWYRRGYSFDGVNYTYTNEVKYDVVSIGWEDRNYIREHDVLKANKTTWTAVDQLATGDKLVTTTYLDGIGRPVQKLAKEVATPAVGTSTWGDIVQYFQYDKLGLTPEAYLPYTTTTNTGKFKTDATTAQAAYYNTNYSDTKPFSETSYEASPLNRVTAVKAPGQTWNATTGDRVGYYLNTGTEDVKHFTIGTAETSMPVLSGINNGVYPANTLLKTEAIDIYGAKTISYYDDNGLMVLKQVQADLNIPTPAYDTWICTYYVYDDMGRLRCEIEPEGVKWLATQAITTDRWRFDVANGSTVFNEQCFVYAYDEKGRTVYKKTPGNAYLRMLYDNRDRLVYMQDGNQRDASLHATPELTVNMYDALDRVVLTTLYYTSQTPQQLQTALDNAVTTTTAAIANPGGPLEELVVTSFTTGKPKYSATKNVTVDDGFESMTGEFTVEIDPNAITDPVTTTTTVHKSPLSAATLAGAGCTVLKYFYYDNYSYPTARAFDAGASTAATLYTPSADVLTIAATQRTTGMPTGTLTRVLGTNNFLATTSYYDEDGNPIQTLDQNIKLGFDITTSQYGWDGRLLASNARHAMPGGELDKYDVKTKYLFDQVGRATSIQKQFGTNALWTMAAYQYDDLGRVKKKTLDPNYTHPIAGIGMAGNGLESVDYSYDVQGTLTGLNKDYALKASGYSKWQHFFGTFLGYADNGNAALTGSRLNGQMNGQVWTTMGDDDQRKFQYSYDDAGRLAQAAFQNKEPAVGTWTNSKLDFSTQGAGTGSKIQYDLNGNLKSLRHMGFQFGNTTPVRVDDLTYTYNSFSNRLQKVTDNMTVPSINGTQGDFKDGSNGSTPDYVYDNNGNLVADLNKDIKDLPGSGTNGVRYNYLDKPEEINLAGKGTIKITYDADGAKLKRTYTKTDGTVKTTYYLGAYTYEETNTVQLACQFISFEEGRIRLVTPRNESNGYDAISLAGNITLPNSRQGSIDYYIVDQRHDVRMILTEETQYSLATASMESDNGRGTIEEGLFGQPGNDKNEVYKTRMAKPVGWAGNTSSYASQLNSTNKIGPNQLLKVMAGDQVSTTVQYYYQSTVTNTSGSTVFSSVLDALVGAITGTAAVNSGAKGITATTGIRSGLNTGTPFTQLISPDITSATGDKPKAYLNVVFFDERFNFVSSGSTSQRVVTPGDGQSLTIPQITVPKNGYCLVYVSNEANQTVFFDNMVVRHDRGRIIEENHYYSYGLRIAAISSKAYGAPNNAYQYQGDFSEFDDDLGWNDFMLRSYDAQIGRFLQSDPYDQFASGYTGMGNDPVNNVDPSGGIVPTPGGFWNGSFLQMAGKGGSLIGGGFNISANVVQGQSIGANVFSLAIRGINMGSIIGNTFGNLLNYGSGREALEFESKDEAAFDWAYKYSKYAGDDREYASTIYSYVKKGKTYYSYNGPFPGAERSSNFHYDDIPKGAKVEAGIHCHIDTETFSYTKAQTQAFDSDEKVMGYNENESRDFYLVTPKGMLKVRRAGELLQSSKGRDDRSGDIILATGLNTETTIKFNNSPLTELKLENWQGSDGQKLNGQIPKSLKKLKIVNSIIYKYILN